MGRFEHRTIPPELMILLLALCLTLPSCETPGVVFAVGSSVTISKAASEGAGTASAGAAVVRRRN